MGLETRIFENGTASFGQTGPTGQIGPPLEVDHFLRKIFTWTEAFHLSVPPKFPEILAYRKAPDVSWKNVLKCTFEMHKKRKRKRDLSRLAIQAFLMYYSIILKLEPLGKTRVRRLEISSYRKRI